MKGLENISLLGKSIIHHKRIISPHSLSQIDGSQNAFKLIDDLALLGDSFANNTFHLYSAGVYDHQEHVFDPSKVLHNIMTDDSYRHGHTIKRPVSMASGKFCCVAPEDKLNLMWNLSNHIDLFFQDPGNSSISTEKLRQNLLMNGVKETHLKKLSNKALITYLVANETQFSFAMIHPFWERNGRTSEEIMHLVCATNGIQKLVFWSDINQRHNAVTIERMNLINMFAISLLPEIAKKMGININGHKINSVQDLYKLWFLKKGSATDYMLRSLLQNHTPIKYLQTPGMLLASPDLMESYFEALKIIVEERIDLISHDKIINLIDDPIVCKLLAHYLINGVQVDMSKINTIEK